MLTRDLEDTCTVRSVGRKIKLAGLADENVMTVVRVHWKQPRFRLL